MGLVFDQALENATAYPVLCLLVQFQASSRDLIVFRVGYTTGMNDDK
jgi:hypothetical protein